MINKETWENFRETGLILYINQIIHVFGWAIVIEIENDKVIDCYPARVKFRGFDNKKVSESYKNITDYLSKNISQLINDVKD